MFPWTFRKTGSITLPCDPGLAFDILTDYDAYTEWMTCLSNSKLLAREGDLAIAEFALRHGAKEKFAVECIHTRNKMVLTRTISGRVPLVQIQWTLEPEAGKGCKVTVAIDGKAGLLRLLPGYRTLIHPAACLKALAGQMASYSSDLAVQDGGGEKIFELVETEEGMICTVRGKKYRLTPTGEETHD